MNESSVKRQLAQEIILDGPEPIYAGGMGKKNDTAIIHRTISFVPLRLLRVVSINVLNTTDNVDCSGNQRAFSRHLFPDSGVMIILLKRSSRQRMTIKMNSQNKSFTDSKPTVTPDAARADQPPDQEFFQKIKATGNILLWDPGAYGYAIYNPKGGVEALRNIAKKYGMRASYFKATQGLWISRKNAIFDK